MLKFCAGDGVLQPKTAQKGPALGWFAIAAWHRAECFSKIQTQETKTCFT